MSPQIQTPLSAQPINGLVVHRHRRPLTRTLHKLSTGAVTLGFAGGSITADYNHNWPTPVANWFVATFPNVRFTVENSAIGATGSDSGCLRAQRELIARPCDLTFVEYAVNDFDDPTPRRNRSREGLIRQLLAAGQDVIIVYTYRQNFYAEMIEGKVPASIAEFEVIAEHYGLSSVWMGLASFQEVIAGRMKWEDWLPDGLHPSLRGSVSYAAAVTALLKVELAPEKIAAAQPPLVPQLPVPLDSGNWQNISTLPFSTVRTAGPWLIKRFSTLEHLDQGLETHAPGARLEFDFTGRGLLFIIQYGKRSAEFNYRIDGGEWIPMVRERYDWSGDRNMVRATFITEDLSPGSHHFELVVTHGQRPDCTGTEFRLGSIGILA